MIIPPVSVHGCVPLSRSHAIIPFPTFSSMTSYLTLETFKVVINFQLHVIAIWGLLASTPFHIFSFFFILRHLSLQSTCHQQPSVCSCSCTSASALRRRTKEERDSSLLHSDYTQHTHTPWCGSSAQQSPPGCLSTSLRRASPHLHAPPAPEYGVYGISLNLICVVFSISEYPTQFQAADAEVACFRTQLRCRQEKSATRWQGQRI